MAAEQMASRELSAINPAAFVLAHEVVGEVFGVEREAAEYNENTSGIHDEDYTSENFSPEVPRHRSGCMDEDEERRLMVQAVAGAGDINALTEVFVHYRPLLMGIVRRKYRLSESDAEDIASTAYVRFLKMFNDGSIGLPERKNAGMCILLRITNNLAIDYFRNPYVKRRSPIAIEEHFANRANAGSMPGELEDRAAAADAIECVYRALSPAQREIVRLRYGEDLSLEEVAARSGRKLGTVKSSLHRATQIAHRLEADGRVGRPTGSIGVPVSRSHKKTS